MLPDPIYDAYAAPIALMGRYPTPVPATLHDGRFTIGLSDLEELLESQRHHALLLNTPWNPVGTVMTPRSSTDIMGFAQETRLPGDQRRDPVG